MKTSKPFREGRFAEADGSMDWPVAPGLPPLGDALTHYEQDGLIVSVLRSVWGWEAWAGRGNGGFRHSYLTSAPLVFDTEAEAIAYRDGLFDKED